MAILGFAVIFIVAGLFFIKWPDFQHNSQVGNSLQRPSRLYVRLTIQYDKPPIYLKQYTMRNDNGSSSAQYKITGYSGKVVTISLPPEQTYAVTFFFEEVVADGAWQIVNAPPLGNTDVHYTFFIHQVAEGKQGSRKVAFTDPHYWAVTAGRQFHIHMSKGGQTPNLVTLQSTSIAEPRYEKIVNAFRHFGSSSFRMRIVQAQAMIRRSR